MDGIFIWKGCDPRLMDGVASFESAYTRSHTVTSRRYSIWALLEDHVDSPVQNFFARTGTPDMFGASFSRWLRTQTMSGMSLFIKKNIQKTGRSDDFVACMETLLELAYFCLSKTPTKSVRGLAKKGEAAINYGKVVDHIHYPYCELCWRLSHAAEINMDHPELTFASPRFCVTHSPTDPTSEYRKDHRFRARFHAKLISIKRSGEKLIGDVATTRKRAYDLARASTVSRSASITDLYASGLSQSQIANILGISRQAVHKHLKAKSIATQ